jgi:hypothetical protein
MSVITQQYVAVTGDTITASIWNTEFQNIINTFNGGIDNANIQAAAGIAYTKLALNGAILNSDLAGSIDKAKITNTAVTLTDIQALSNKTLTKPTVNASVHPITTVSYSGSIVFDLDTSNHFYVTLGGTPTMSINNGDDGQCFIVHLNQGTGGFTVTWWLGLRWAGGVIPTLSTGANKIDTFGFIVNGSDTYGYVIGKNI